MSDLRLEIPLITVYVDPTGGVASIHAPEHLPRNAEAMVVVRPARDPERILDLRVVDPDLLEAIWAARRYLGRASS